MQCVNFRHKRDEYLLFQQYLNGNFPKLVDNNECHENTGYSPHVFCFTKAPVIPCVSITKNAGMGFVCAELEMRGYYCGDTVSVLSCE